MLAPLMAAGASLIGNLFGQSNQAAINNQNIWAQNYQNELNRQAAVANQQAQIAHTQEINAQNIGFQRETNLANQAFAREQSAASMAQADRLNAMALADKERDRALQQDFAQMGIKWRVEDAERAGVHPLFALSGGGASYSPSAISLSGGSFPSATSVAPQAQAASLGSLPAGVASRAVAGNAFANMGQDLSRAVLAAASEGTRNSAFEGAYQDLQLKNLGLRNDLIASQIARLGQAGGVSKPVGDEWPGTLEVKETPQTPVMHRGAIGNMPKGNMDAQSGADVFGEGLGEYVTGAMNAYDWFNFNPGTAYRYFQWVNSNMISRQMRQEYFDSINVPKYQMQGPAYMRRNWKGHY